MDWNPTKIDPDNAELWVIETDGERGVLYGNPHTHPGRFSVWWESTRDFHATSRSDIAEMSDAARWWIEGFMVGNEPDVSACIPDVDYYEASVEQLNEWNWRLDEFRERGFWQYPRPAGDDLDLGD